MHHPGPLPDQGIHVGADPLAADRQDLVEDEGLGQLREA
jgi:hypothetical protein